MENLNLDEILEKDARRKALQNARAKRFYDKHKLDILAKQKENKQKTKELVKIAKQQQQQRIPQPPPPEEPTPEPERTIILLKNNKTNKNTFSLDINSLKTLIDGLDKSPLTKKKYGDDAVILFRILNVKKLNTIIKTPKKIFSVIENSKAQNGEDYSNNTKKGLAQVLLIICDNGWVGADFKEKNHNAFKDFFDRYDFLTREQTKQNKNIVLHDIDNYVQRVKDTFGEDSKQFLIALLYKESTRRDDFQLHIINNMAGATDASTNYILVPANGSVCSTIINAHKTASHFEPLVKKLSAYLSRLIRNYIINKSLKVGDFLFGKGKLTAYVSKMSADVGLKGITISTLRKMAITKYLETDRTMEERQILAREFGHSLGVQEGVYRGRLGTS